VSIRQDTLRTLVFQCVMLASGLVTNVLVARTLGPTGKGLLSFLGSALFVAISLGGIGLHAAAIHHLGRRRFSPNTIAATQILLAIVMGTVCAIGMAIVLPLYRARMDLPSAIYFPFLPVAIFSLVLLNLSGVFVGLGRIRDDNYIRLLTPLAWMLGATVVLGILHGSRTAAALTWIAAQSVSAIAALVWIFIIARPQLAHWRECARATLRFGFEAYFANLLWVLLLRADSMLLGYYSGAAAVGIYSVAVLFAELIWYLSRALTTALSPRIARGTPAEAIALTHRAARSVLWAVIVAAVGMALLIRPVVQLIFGSAFSSSVRPFLLLLPGIVLGALASPLSLYFTQHRGRPRINALISGVGLALNIGLNIFWIPRYGISGAAAASSVAYSLVAVLLLWRFSREPGFSLERLLRPRAEDIQLMREVVQSARAALPGGRER
jgi:O-antigen/teichoic acid export membrane protein